MRIRHLFYSAMIAHCAAAFAQDETVTGNLTVTGSLAVSGQTANRKVLELGGDLNTYYPVFFNDPSWYYGEFDLQIYRPHVHWDSDWYGVLMARFKSHSTNYGHGGEFVDATIRSEGEKFIADYKTSYYPAGLVVWLKGQTRYDYHSKGALPDLVYNDAGDGVITISGAPYSTFAARTTVSDGILLNGHSFSDNVYIEGKAGVGVQNPQAKLEVNGQFRVTGLGPIPSSGKGVEVYWGESANIGDIFAYNRDINAMLPLRIRGSKILLEDGNVGIGTTNPQNKLDVNGTIRAKEVIVESGWADHVFADGYALLPLAEVEAHIAANRRLPGVPSAEEVAASGVSIGESQRMLLEKVEELTLYMLQQQREIESLKRQISRLTEPPLTGDN